MVCPVLGVSVPHRRDRGVIVLQQRRPCCRRLAAVPAAGSLLLPLAPHRSAAKQLGRHDIRDRADLAVAVVAVGGFGAEVEGKGARGAILEPEDCRGLPRRPLTHLQVDAGWGGGRGAGRSAPCAHRNAQTDPRSRRVEGEGVSKMAQLGMGARLGHPHIYAGIKVPVIPRHHASMTLSCSPDEACGSINLGTCTCNTG